MQSSTIQSNNITTTQCAKSDITKSDLKLFIEKIFKNKTFDFIEKVSNSKHPSGKTNGDFHMSTINNLINIVIKSNKKDFMLSRVSLRKTNFIHFDLHIQKNDDNIQFYFCGPDLVNYYMFLPKTRSGPKTGSNKSKWYQYCDIELIKSIANKLRLLEVGLLNVNIVDTYIESKLGILGVEVVFDIPEKYKEYSKVSDNISNNKNPIKISDGIFLYGKNGVVNIKSQFIIEKIRTEFVHISTLLFPFFICDYNLTDFHNSDYKYAVCSWNNHIRILTKLSIMKNKINIWIIDPWMDRLPRSINDNLIVINPSIKIGFYARNRKDQTNEGSCLFCALSRLVMLIDSDKPIIDSLKEPIDDFYAYFVKLFL